MTASDAQDYHADRKADQRVGQLRAQREGDPKWQRRQRIAKVVDQIGQQRDAPAHREHHRLSRCREAQHSQRQQYRADALMRALDAPIDQAVRVAMLVRGVVVCGMVVRRMVVRRVVVRGHWLRQSRQCRVTVRSNVRMRVDPAPVAMRQLVDASHD